MNRKIFKQHQFLKITKLSTLITCRIIPTNELSKN